MPICQQTLEQSAEEIGNTATSGQFLDPNENPSTILQSMREVRSSKKKKVVCNSLVNLNENVSLINGNF